MKIRYKYAVERRFRRKGSPWVVSHYTDGWKGCEKSFLQDVADDNRDYPRHETRLCRVTEIRTPVKEIECKNKKPKR